MDAMPLYAIEPQGLAAGEGYERLRQFLQEQHTDGVERVSLAGVIVGKARLMSGTVVPVVRPDLRCMYSWSTTALVDAVVGKASEQPDTGDDTQQARRHEAVTAFLDRTYHEIRNLGLTPGERAVNYAASNAFGISRVFESALRARMELDAVEVERSPICRPESDCWDVKLLFFDPENVARSRKAYRFAVDVSDVCPVLVGDVRSWSVR